MTNLTQRSDVNDEILFEESYQRVLPEMRALSPDELMQITIDVPSAISTVLGVVKELPRYRDAMTKQLPEFDLARFDRLEEYAMALSHANTLYATATKPPDDLKAVYEEGLKLRERLHADTTTLVVRELINPSTLKEYTGLVGHKNVATELQILAQVLKESFKQIEGKCAATVPEIDRALKVAARLLRIVGEREQRAAVVQETTDLRNRAFTLFDAAYDEARRGIIYLRWHEGDADTVTPSLYAGRGGTRRRAEPESGTSDAGSVPPPDASGVSETPQRSPTSPANAATGTTAGRSAADVAASGPFIS